MAAYTSQHHQVPLFLDSLLLPNNATPTPIKNMSNTNNMSGFIDEAAAAGNFINNTNCFSQFYQPETFPLDVRFHESSSHLDHSSNETCVTKKQSTESSTVVDNKLESGEQVTQKVTSTPPMDTKRKNNNGSFNSAQSKDHGREGKGKKQKKCSGDTKEEEKKPKLAAERKVPEEPPTGYIHVRARRGQATDSHSLAERVRREKISERMKILQRLVPGCDKVTGKALMLDEIINYVQSLQNQVEFLSMKLASVNPLFYDFGMDIDAFMIRTERLSSMSSPPLPSLQQCSPMQPTAFADATTATTATATTTSPVPTTTTFATANNYPLIDSSLLLHGMRPVDFTTDQDCGSLMWDVEEQRQKILNPSGFTNNLCSFH